MELLFIGDVVGSIGRDMITEYLPQLKKSVPSDSNCH